MTRQRHQFLIGKLLLVDLPASIWGGMLPYMYTIRTLNINYQDYLIIDSLYSKITFHVDSLYGKITCNV
jgi:hypothetical protein